MAEESKDPDDAALHAVVAEDAKVKQAAGVPLTDAMAGINFEDFMEDAKGWTAEDKVAYAKEIEPGLFARALEPRTDAASLWHRFVFKNFFVAHAIPDLSDPAVVPHVVLLPRKANLPGNCQACLITHIRTTDQKRRIRDEISRTRYPARSPTAAVRRACWAAAMPADDS